MFSKAIVAPLLAAFAIAHSLPVPAAAQERLDHREDFRMNSHLRRGFLQAMMAFDEMLYALPGLREPAPRPAGQNRQR